MQRPRLSEPAGRRLLAMNHDQTRILGRNAIEDRTGRIGRPIVDDDHFKRRIALREKSARRAFDRALFISRRNDDRDEWLALERRLSRAPEDEKIDDDVEEREAPVDQEDVGENAHITPVLLVSAPRAQ